MKKIKVFTMIFVSMCTMMIPFSSKGEMVDAVQSPSVTYQAHVQNIGWQNYVKDGELAGTVGRGLRVESFRMNLLNLPVAGDINYATHIENEGWHAPSKNNEISGTVGQALRMEAIRINLTGEIEKQYDVYYRTHVQNYGWLGWSKNGEEAGSEGYGLRMESIEVRLVKKGDFAPGTGNGFIMKPKSPSVNYQAHVQNIGWQSYVKNGAVAGTFGRGLRVESFRMNLTNLPVAGDISYSTHIQNIGWQSPRTSDQISGTTGQSLRMEAMRIYLTGEIENQYDIYYRTHVQNVGWLGWAKNGENAGTEGRSLRMEAIEIRLVKKGELAPRTGNAFLEKPAPIVVPTPSKPKEYYNSCVEMRKVHPQGAVKGDPWYNPVLDRDSDGRACENNSN
ncbi:MAG: excalibur calcium-binding domain-containing protein [Culicoidibacterales bacterium]